MKHTHSYVYQLVINKNRVWASIRCISLALSHTIFAVFVDFFYTFCFFFWGFRFPNWFSYHPIDCKSCKYSLSQNIFSPMNSDFFFFLVSSFWIVKLNYSTFWTVKESNQLFESIPPHITSHHSTHRYAIFQTVAPFLLYNNSKCAYWQIIYIYYIK